MSNYNSIITHYFQNQHLVIPPVLLAIISQISRYNHKNIITLHLQNQQLLIPLVLLLSLPKSANLTTTKLLLISFQIRIS